MAFQFLQRLSDFPQRLSTSQEIWEKSIYGGKYTKDCYPSFVFQQKLRYCAIKIIGGKNMKDHLSELRIFRFKLRNSC
jgi:hypothetical protein